MSNQANHSVQFILLLYEKILRPKKFKCDPSSAGLNKKWTHWLRTFENFQSAITTQEINKFAGTKCIWIHC